MISSITDGKMNICDDVWCNILEFASKVPRHAHVCRLFKGISDRIYTQSIIHVSEKYHMFEGHIYHGLNYAAFNNEWDDFLILLRFNEQARAEAARLALGFEKMDLFCHIARSLSGHSSEYLYYLWHIKSPIRLKETRKFLFSIDNKVIHCHPDMMTYIKSNEELLLRYGKFLPGYLEALEQKLLEVLKPTDTISQALFYCDIGLILGYWYSCQSHIKSLLCPPYLYIKEENLSVIKKIIERYPSALKLFENTPYYLYLLLTKQRPKKIEITHSSVPALDLIPYMEQRQMVVQSQALCSIKDAKYTITLGDRDITINEEDFLYCGFMREMFTSEDIVPIHHLIVVPDDFASLLPYHIGAVYLAQYICIATGIKMSRVYLSHRPDIAKCLSDITPYMISGRHDSYLLLQYV